MRRQRLFVAPRKAPTVRRRQKVANRRARMAAPNWPPPAARAIKHRSLACAVCVRCRTRTAGLRHRPATRRAPAYLAPPPLDLTQRLSCQEGLRRAVRDRCLSAGRVRRVEVWVSTRIAPIAAAPAPPQTSMARAMGTAQPTLSQLRGLRQELLPRATETGNPTPLWTFCSGTSATAVQSEVPFRGMVWRTT
jgi:hypothetical protein